MRYEPIGEARYAVDLSGSATRIRQHQKTAAEYLIGAEIYCLKLYDYEAAEFINAHKKALERGEATAAFPVLSAPLKSLREVTSEREALTEDDPIGKVAA